jgi:TonB family protein
MTARRICDSAAVASLAVLASLFVTVGATSAQGAGDAAQALARAKEMYLSASYDEALTVLDGVQEEAPNGAAMEIAQYRVFCLMALGRGDDAKKTMESMVSVDPFYRLPDALTPPRIRTAYQDTRRAMLPLLVQRRYMDAKTAFDKKDPRAVDYFDRVLALIDDPELKGGPAMADLRTVASGFRDLAKAASAPPPPPPPAPVVAPPPPETPAQPRRAAAPPAGNEIVPPVTISQPMPRWAPMPPYDRMTYRGSVVVLVNEQGDVAAVTIQKSIHPAFDRDLVKMARTWKFKPAMRNGAPTEFEKVVEIELKPTR